VALGNKASATADFVSSVWSFPDQDPTRAAPYRWYGTLPTGLLDQLFDLYASAGSSFLDPFCGTGTSLLTAAGRGVHSLGMDVNPLAVLISQLQLSPPHAAELTGAWDTVARLAAEGASSRRSVTTLARHLRAGELQYTRRWIGERALARLWLVLQAIATADIGTAARRGLLVAFASIVRDVANVDPRCTHHLVTKLKPYVDCASLLDSRVPLLAGQVGMKGAHFTGTETEVVQGDFSSDPPASEYDFVLLHPPYLGVIHYNQIHRLATDLIDLVNRTTPVDVLGQLSWDHSTIKSGDMSTDNSARYEDFVARVADSTVKVTAVGGRAVVIIGDQRNKSLLRHPFTSYIHAFEARGLALEENFIWVLQNNGGMHVLRRGHYIDHNYVLVFKRLP